MDGSLIYRKTRRGAAELTATHGGHVATPSRRVLIVLDGRRTVDELAELFGAEAVEHALAELEAQGLARLVDPEGGTTTQQVQLPGDQYPPREPDLAPLSAKPRRRGLVLIALALPALAIGGGFWVVASGNRPADAQHDPIAAVARPASAPVEPVVQAPDPGEPTGGTPFDGPKELPLSGLPPVIVTKVAATTAAPAGAEALAATRRAPDRSGAAPAEAAPSPASAAAPEAGSRTSVAAAAAPESSPGRPREALAAAPAASSPATVVAVDVGAGQTERVALRAPPAEPVTPGAAPPAPPPVQVAATAPTPLPATEAIVLHPRKRDPPQFPGRALRAKIEEGRVLARIWVTSEGKVEQVDIVNATPPRVFDDEVRRALSAWTFDPPGQQVNRTVELTFKP
jgi:protein TonB